MTILGFLAFLLIFSFLIFIHEFGHFIVARKSGVKVLEFGMGMGKKILGKKVGETEYTINLIPFGGFIRMLGEEEKSDDPRSFECASLWKRMGITLAGVFMNFVFAILGFTILFSVGTSPILVSENDIRDAYEKGTIGFEAKDGTSISVERALNSENQQDITLVFYEKLRVPIHVAFVLATKKTYQISLLVVDRVLKLPGEIIKEKSLPDDIGGPVKIASIVDDALSQGFWFLFKISILLSISLAVMNLLPIPALDGGRFLFQIIELFLKFFKKKPKPELEMAVHFAGFMILMVFMIAVTIRDVAQINWFG